MNYNLRSSDSVSSQTYPGFDTDRTNRSQSVAAGGIHRFSPRLIMNYRAVLSHVKTQSTNPFSFVEDVEGKLGIEGVSRDPINFGIPNITFTNYGDLQLAPPSVSRYQTVTLAGGLNKIGNKHSIRVGGDFSWNQRDNRVDANARGTFDYTGFASSAFDSKGRPIAGTGYDFADFLLGFPYSTSRRFGSSDTYLRNVATHKEHRFLDFIRLGTRQSNDAKLSTKLTFKESARSLHGMVMTNAAKAGDLIAAGASAEGFTDDELLSATHADGRTGKPH